jgi:hypothetical protein
VLPPGIFWDLADSLPIAFDTLQDIGDLLPVPVVRQGAH